MKKLFVFIGIIFLASFHNYAKAAVVPVSLDFTPYPIGSGWEVVCSQSLFGTCLVWDVAPVVDHSVFVTLSDNTVDEFIVSAITSYADPNGFTQGYLSLSPISLLGTLEFLDNIYYDFLMEGNLVDMNIDVINPFRYRYTLNEIVYNYPQDFNAVPIPGAIWLLGSGLTGIVALRRRKKKHKQLTLTVGILTVEIHNF